MSDKKTNTTDQVTGHILLNSIICLTERPSSSLTRRTGFGLPPPTYANLAAIPRPENKSRWSTSSVHTHMLYTKTHLIRHRLSPMQAHHILLVPSFFLLQLYLISAANNGLTVLTIDYFPVNTDFDLIHFKIYLTLTISLFY